MQHLANAMAFIALAWLVWFPVLMGCGLLIFRALGARDLNIDRSLLSFWAGLAGVIVFLQLWNFFLPVNSLAASLLIAAGSLGLLMCWPQLVSIVQRINRTDVPWLILAFLLVLWCLNRGIAADYAIDSGMYHTSAVKWTATYPVIPGLANLNTQFGLNSSYWLLGALMQFGVWEGRGANILTPLLATVALFQIGLALRRVFDAGSTPATHSIFDAALLTPVLHNMLGPNAASFTNDFPTGLLIFVALSRLVRVLTSTESQSPHPQQSVDRSINCFAVALIASAAITIKISSIFIGLGLVFVSLLMIRFVPRRFLLASIMLAACALMAVGFVGRNIILTGYLAYPSSIGRLEVDWVVPKDITSLTYGWVVQYARSQIAAEQQILTGVDWIPMWLRDQLTFDPFLILYPILISIATITIAFITGLRPRLKLFGPITIVLALGVVFWIVTAPSRRFGFFMFWPLAALSLAAVYHAFAPRLTESWSRRIALALVALAIPGFVARAVIVNRLPTRGFIALAETCFNGPGPDRGFHSKLPTKLQPVSTSESLDVLVPTASDTDRLISGRVLDSPLPATPYPIRGLRLRVTGSLASGFALPPDAKMTELFPVAGSPFNDMWRRATESRIAPPEKAQ